MLTPCIWLSFFLTKGDFEGITHMEIDDFKRVYALEPMVRDIWAACGGAPEYIGPCHLFAINTFLVDNSTEIYYKISKAVESIPWRTDEKYFAVLCARMIEYSTKKKCDGIDL
jgi:hypothetical protein